MGNTGGQMNGEMNMGGNMNGGNMQNAGMNGGQVNGNWQPQPQMMPQQKPPMDPAKKKKIILGVSLGVGGVVIAIVAVVVASILLKVDYGESYRVAKELKPKVSDISDNYDCERVVDYVNSAYTSDATYAEYVSSCLSVADGVEDLVTKLGQTAGIRHDKDLKAQFERFEEAIDSVLPDEEELGQRLKVYEAWHKFTVVVDDLSAGSSSDAEIQNAAKNLTESGNEVLATYGAGWLEKTQAYIRAYREYYNTPGYSAALVTAKNNAQTEQKNWIAANKPDIVEVGGLSFENTSKMYTEFTKLYDMIVELYEQNYDEASGDCTTFLDEVYCN